MVGDAVIVDLLKQVNEKGMDEVADKLIDAANEAGGLDNISVMLVR
jgi:serine/threonine protein phosphatase PrpC